MFNFKNHDGADLMHVRGTAFELHKRGVARWDFSDPYHMAVTLSWPAFITAAFSLLVSINLLFAALYVARPGAVQNLPPGDLMSAFFFSVETLATVGYGEMAPATTYGHIIVSLEIVVGMAFTAIVTGLLFVRFSKPQAKILFADHAVVTNHNGRPTLMVRIANGRLTTLTNAKAQIGLLMAEVSSEGQMFRRVHDLTLQRETLPVFPLTWTLMHMINDDSPLKGLATQDLFDQDVRMFVTVEALDVELGARVQALQVYDHRQVALGMRYCEAVSRDEAGRTIADLGRLSLMEADDPVITPAGAGRSRAGEMA